MENDGPRGGRAPFKTLVLTQAAARSSAAAAAATATCAPPPPTRTSMGKEEEEKKLRSARVPIDPAGPELFLFFSIIIAAAAAINRQPPGSNFRIGRFIVHQCGPSQKYRAPHCFVPYLGHHRRGRDIVSVIAASKNSGTAQGSSPWQLSGSRPSAFYLPGSSKFSSSSSGAIGEKGFFVIWLFNPVRLIPSESAAAY